MYVRVGYGRWVRSWSRLIVGVRGKGGTGGRGSSLDPDPRLKGKMGLDADFVRSRGGRAGDLGGRGVVVREEDRRADA